MKTKEMIKVAIFPALIAATIGISIPLTGAPITLQTLFVILAGLLLGANLGLTSMILYLILGLIGIPIFAGFSSGFGIIFGPTGGFLIAFPIAAFVAGYVRSKYNNYTIAAVAATLVVYIIGAPWMSLYLGWSVWATLTFLTVYIPGDIIKIIAAVIIAKRLKTRI